MLDYNDPITRPAIDVLVSILKTKVDTYKLHHTARQPKGKVADPNITRMAALPKSDAANVILDTLDEQLASMTNFCVESVPNGEEHLYAVYALKFQAIADHFKDIAKTWAPEFAHVDPAVEVPDGFEPMSEEDLIALAKDCDDAFRLVLTSVNQIKDRLNDADAITDIESITGQSTVVRQSSKDSSVQYLLDIPRIRKRQAKDSSTTTSVSSESTMSLTVDSIDMEQGNFGRDCQYAFSLSGPQFLDKVREQLDTVLFNAPFEFEHDGKIWEVVINRK